MQDPLLDCEEDIREFLAEHITSQCPPMLAQAMEYAVFPGGARVRPQLCMAVALALLVDGYNSLLFVLHWHEYSDLTYVIARHSSLSEN